MWVNLQGVVGKASNVVDTIRLAQGSIQSCVRSPTGFTKLTTRPPMIVYTTVSPSGMRVNRDSRCDNPRGWVNLCVDQDHAARRSRSYRSHLWGFQNRA